MSLEQNTLKLLSTYRRLPIAFSHGEGAWLYDTNDNQFLDAISGIGVCNLGHNHPNVTKAIQDQCRRLLHTSNLYHIPLQSQLANELSSISGMSGCFFGNSGAEANEAAIKIARLYGHQRNIETPNIIVMEGAFHGRTLATLSATANRQVQAGFEPLVGGFVRAPYNDVEAVRNIAENNKDIVAILVEPIQGEGGIQIPDKDYLAGLRNLCDDNQWLLMLDEIQSGNGRTGKYFAYQHTTIKPDVVTTAKGLANGVPIGVCLASGIAAEVFKPGNHGSTFGGNPLACAAGLAVINTLFDDNLIENANKMGHHIKHTIDEAIGSAEYITEIRQQGLMIGIELDQPCSPLVELALTKGLLINVTSSNVIRLLPPLIINEEQAEQIAQTIIKLIKTYVGDDRAKPR